MSNVEQPDPFRTRQRIDFKYDYLGRRIEKRVVDLDTSAETLARRFLYDGWNLIAEIDANTPATILRSYAWGLDLTGERTRSGGIGALLRMTNYSSGAPGTSYYPSYDGNGNVVSLVNASTGDLAAAYEYDPFGRFLRNEAIDSAVADAPFRFSTKYYDAELRLSYYGYRYYSADLGRFVNRDPIEERGGHNLYAFVQNNAINRWDYLGMIEEPDEFWDQRSGDQPRESRGSANSMMAGGDYSGLILDLMAAEHMSRIAAYERNQMSESLAAGSRDMQTIAEIQKRLSSGHDVKVIDASGNQTTLKSGMEVTFGSTELGSVTVGSLAPNNASGPGIGLPSEVAVVPAGSTGIRIIGTNSANPSAAVADAAATLVYLRQNSPTLDNAVRTVVANTGYIGIAPVSAASGGRAVSNTAVYGTGVVYMQDNGGIIYPAYTLAHEIGHLYDFATGGTRGQSSLTMTDAQRALAPNVTELYAFNFANQVAAEIRQNTGQNFASPQTYTNSGPGTIAPGPSYPPKQ